MAGVRLYTEEARTRLENYKRPLLMPHVKEKILRERLKLRSCCCEGVEAVKEQQF